MPRAAHNFIDLSGRAFGRLVVVTREQDYISPKGQKQARWQCRCECGRLTVVLGQNLAKGKVISCGCYRREQAQRMGRQFKRAGLNRLPLGQAPFNHLYYRYQASAATKDYEWGLSMEQFRTLTLADCYYCGVPPSRVHKLGSPTTSEVWRELNMYKYNGIDRFMNDRGYTPENCVPCCTECNYRKRAASGPEFIEWLRRIAENKPWAT